MAHSYPFQNPSLRAQCLKVVDGDTIDLFTDEGKRRYAVDRYRLLTVDTYELNDKDEERRALAKAAKAKMIEWCQPVQIRGLVDLTQWPLRITTHKSDSFGRWLAEIYWTDDEGVEHHANAELIEQGLGEVYKR
jgi:endonuclease YncB( thermonuclease family)